ncbi:MAG: DUF2188 domain-containing protein [Anaerolineae bacterium]
MPWTANDYPVSMKNLTAEVREKAVEIANALLKDGYEEGRAISIATAQAEEWAQNRGKQVKKKTAEDK